jgi:hypothetical protein
MTLTFGRVRAGAITGKDRAPAPNTPDREPLRHYRTGAFTQRAAAT